MSMETEGKRKAGHSHNSSVFRERKKRGEKFGVGGTERERENKKERRNTKGTIINQWIPKCLVYDFLLFSYVDFFP